MPDSWPIRREYLILRGLACWFLWLYVYRSWWLLERAGDWIHREMLRGDWDG